MTNEEALKWNKWNYQAFTDVLWDGNEDNNKYDKAFCMAISALEKQIAKKPTENEYGHKCCPLCSWTVDDSWNYDLIKIPHCKYCGQAIDWGEE